MATVSAVVLFLVARLNYCYPADLLSNRSWHPSTTLTTRVQEEFEKHEIDGVGLLGLTEGDLHHKLHLKKVFM